MSGVRKLNTARVFRGGSGASFEIVSDGEEIRKTIRHSSERARKLALQYEWLLARQGLEHIVSVKDMLHESDECHYTMKFYDGYLSCHQFLKASDFVTTEQVVARLLEFLQHHIHKKTYELQSEGLFYSYLRTKLFDKVTYCSFNSPLLRKVMAYENLVINGRTYLNFNGLYQILASSRRILENNKTFQVCDIHGDLTLENILINPSDHHFVLIDPNTENSISSPLIDYSKLMQSASSKYEFMEDVPVKVSGNSIDYSMVQLLPDHVTEAIKGALSKELPAQDFKALTLYEAVNFSRMLPYKLELSASNFIIYYARMIILLNEYLQSEEEL